MNVRILTPADLEAHCRVSSMAFHWKCDLKEETFPEHDVVLGCFDDDGAMAADLEYLVRDATWGDTAVPLVCIGGVASLPHYRNCGAVRKLFEELEIIAQREGWVLGALYPFTDGYYRMFGYERMSRCLDLEAPMQAIIDFAKLVPKEQQGRLELIEGETLPEDLLQAYNTYAARFPLMLRRGQEHARWFHTKPLQTCNYCMLWRNAEGKAEGYIQYSLQMETRTLMVGELAWLTPMALKGLLCFLRGYASKADKVHFCSLPWGGPLPLLLNEHSKNQMSYCKSASVRIYDAEQALLHFCYACDCDFALAIEGDTIERNNATYQISCENGKNHIERIDRPAAITVTREALALLFSGQVGDLMALQCCAGVKIACDAKAQEILHAFRLNTIPLMWDGF